MKVAALNLNEVKFGTTLTSHVSLLLSALICYLRYSHYEIHSNDQTAHLFTVIRGRFTAKDDAKIKSAVSKFTEHLTAILNSLEVRITEFQNLMNEKEAKLKSVAEIQENILAIKVSGDEIQKKIFKSVVSMLSEFKNVCVKCKKALSA